MRKALKDDKLSFYIGDVRDFSSISAAMGGVDYVFQAAALKQVPSCEFFPMEVVRTNVIGTDNVLTAAVQHGVKKAICLSTDKVVYPITRGRQVHQGRGCRLDAPPAAHKVARLPKTLYKRQLVA
jgi:UDP-glucose 4-epimerase